MTSILFRCDASPQIGLGHVIRCLALADELHDVHNCRITFAMRTGPLGIQMVEEKGYKMIISQENNQSFDYRKWLNECAKNVEAKALVLDVRDGLARTVLDELRNKGILIITIDDPEDKRLSADLAFYPPVLQVKRMDWTGFSGELYVGWEWVILRKEFSQNTNIKKRKSAFKILITMGGSDPQGMILKAVKALEMLDEDIEAVVVLGAGFQYTEELDNLLTNGKHKYDVRENVQNMAELMAQSDLAVASFGVTAYELAAMGVPAIYLCLTEDHAESASVFVEADAAVCLGMFTQVGKPTLAKAVRQLLNNASRRLWMADHTRKLVDGRGAVRIARKLTTKVKSAHA